MSDYYNPSIKGTAKTLRKNMTKEEKHLWYDFLKPLPFPVKRQAIFGNYIVDFYIPKYKLVIELDGIQHRTPDGAEEDRIRDSFLVEAGCKVLRYTNIAVNGNFNGVCNDILKHIELI